MKFVYLPTLEPKHVESRIMEDFGIRVMLSVQ